MPVSERRVATQSRRESRIARARRSPSRVGPPAPPARSVAAHAPVPVGRRLQRVQVLTIGQSLDGDDLGVLVSDGKRQAAVRAASRAGWCRRRTGRDHSLSWGRCGPGAHAARPAPSCGYRQAAVRPFHRPAERSRLHSPSPFPGPVLEPTVHSAALWHVCPGPALPEPSLFTRHFAVSVGSGAGAGFAIM
jgi:hypothetical protein